jgi:hypothetical protein
MTMSNSDVLAETAYDLMFNLYPNWTVDHLLAHPAEAIKLCEAVRQKLGKKVADHQVLGALINLRKQGGLSGRKAS